MENSKNDLLFHQVDELSESAEFTYKKMLSDAYSTLGDHAKEKLKIQPPTVTVQGGKHCVLDNFYGICQNVNRDSEHLMKFILTEFGTTGSINGEGGMVLSGRFKPKAFEKIIRNYIKQFVLCPNCRSANTNITRKDRLNYINCDHCTSSVAIQGIEEGFVAKTKSNKKAMALAAAGGK